MNNSTLKFELHGTPDLDRRLRLLATNVAERVVVKAVRKAARPVVSAASRNASQTTSPNGERLGGLSKSQGVVVRKYRNGQKVLGILGPLHGKVFQRHGKKEVPALIAHLVEFGHRVAVGGKLGTLSGRKRRTVATGQQNGFVAAQPFLRPAWDSQKSAAQSTLESELRTGIEAEASR